MLKRTRSILDEIDSHFVSRDKESVLESRAAHVIQGAINLLNIIKESYDEEAAGELERRLINSIRSKDPNKFSRGIKRIRNENRRDTTSDPTE